jgi:hypothetical protein
LVEKLRPVFLAALEGNRLDDLAVVNVPTLKGHAIDLCALLP